MKAGNSSTVIGGFSLLEALLTLFVLSISFLGIASVHLQSLKDNALALQQTRAGYLAENVMERIYANRSNVPGYALGLTAVANVVTTMPASACANIATPCSPTALAADDLTLLQQMIRHRDYGLPNGQIAIAVAPALVDGANTTVHQVTVTINWALNNQWDTGPTNTFVYTGMVNDEL